MFHNEGRKCGYARVSTDEQNSALQIPRSRILSVSAARRSAPRAAKHLCNSRDSRVPGSTLLLARRAAEPLRRVSPKAVGNPGPSRPRAGLVGPARAARCSLRRCRGHAPRRTGRTSTGRSVLAHQPLEHRSVAPCALVACSPLRARAYAPLPILAPSPLYYRVTTSRTG